MLGFFLVLCLGNLVSHKSRSSVVPTYKNSSSSHPSDSLFSHSRYLIASIWLLHVSCMIHFAIFTNSSIEQICTAATDLLKINHPVLLAGMNVAAGPRLAAAVTNAGGLGVIGGVGYTPV
jgi:sugar phosphate permease